MRVEKERSMKKKLNLNRETLRWLDHAGVRQAAGGAAIPPTPTSPPTTNPSAIDACPSTPIWCPQYTQKPCPEPTTVA
jgi:hypothetical protein